MAQKQTFKELNLNNAFLFAAALEDEEICRIVLELVLGIPVGKVKVWPERCILYSSDFRSVRLDIYAEDQEMIAYNLEMQNKNEYDLSKRSRYHQAEMDLASLKPGEDFSSLNPSYIIFICTFDPFGEALYRYTFEAVCKERGFPLGDDTKKIFLSTKGRNREEVPPELIHFLEYVETSTEETVKETEDEIISRLHDRITDLKKSRELEARYMWFEEYLRSETKEATQIARAEGLAEGHVEGRKEGHAEGQKEGAQKMLELTLKMMEDGKKEEIFRLKDDEEFLADMCRKYNL